MNIRVGQGIDVHPFGDGDSVTLGGVLIPHSRGLVGHSDADVLTHAIMDALLGAAGLPDIGHLFPNTNQRFKGARSVSLLQEVGDKLKCDGWEIGNIDSTLLCETPKIAPHIPQMKEAISQALAVTAESIGIKATTAEGLGFIGRKEGIVALATALITKKR